MSVTPRRSAPARIGLFLVRAYRAAISPMLPAACRFVPSCSAYAEEAISAHGLVRGIWLAARRLARCHPLGGRGLDPVPNFPPSPSNRGR
jgi:putative membrane protein insertion efficiency factor